MIRKIIIKSAKHFTKGDRWITNKHMNRCSIALTIREMPPHTYKNGKKINK